MWKGHLGHTDAIASRRDGRVQVGQGLRVIEPGNFRHDAIELVKDPIRFRDEGFAAARASPRHSSACSRRASWRHERAILQAAGTPASSDSRSK